MNVLNQLFVCADDVDLIGEDIDTLQSYREALVGACDEISLQVNVEKTKYMITSRNTENEGNRFITINGAYVTSKNEVTEEIKVA